MKYKRNNSLFRFLKKLVAEPILHNLYKVSYHGAENIPGQGPALIIPKHQSFFDIVFEGIFLLEYCNRYGNWVMKSGLTELYGLLGGIKIGRADDLRNIEDRELRKIKLRQAKALKKEAKELIGDRYQKGEVVVAHAEGTRLKNRVRPLKKGIFDITAEIEREYGTKIPIIPMGIEYQNWPVPGSRVYIRAGEPIDSKTPNLVETVRNEIARLSNL
jgi:1-acyl-sn-glycerol-3-phosphate acyltransferase